MKTIQTKTIDGFQIVTGFPTRPIDPELTRQENSETIYSLPQAELLKTKKREQEVILWKIKNAEQNSIAATIKKNLSEAAKYDQIKSDLLGSYGAINEEMKVIGLELKEAAKDVLRANPVYSGLREGEVEVEDDDFDNLKDMFLNKIKSKLVRTSGEFISDYRGKSFHEKIDGVWSKTEIKTLGVTLTPDQKFYDDLSQSEKDEIVVQEKNTRIENLTDDEKNSEYESLVDNVAGQAVNLRSKLEISGSTADEALFLSQEFYQAELNKLKTEYGIV